MLHIALREVNQKGKNLMTNRKSNNHSLTMRRKERRKEGSNKRKKRKKHQGARAKKRRKEEGGWGWNKVEIIERDKNSNLNIHMTESCLIYRRRFPCCTVELVKPAGSGTNRRD